jgi:hypothetical protein
LSLLYLYWEPSNAESLPAFQAHRDEVKRFTESVTDDQLRFVAQTYLELWRDWDGRDQPSWLREHVANLQARYGLAI